MISPRLFLRPAASCFAAILLSTTAAFAANVTVHVGPSDAPHTFNPANVTINVGDTVTWTVDNFTHTTTSAAGQAEVWDSGDISSGQTFNHTFTNAGDFAYYCKIHGFDNGNGTVGGMSGYVLVEAVAAANATLIGFSVSPTSIVSNGGNVTVTATLSGPAPNDIVIGLSTFSDLITFYQGITIPAGQTTGNQTTPVYFIPSLTVVNITATYNGTTKVAKLTLLPASALTSLTVSPNTIVGGVTTTGKVAISSPSGTNTTVSLSSNNAAAAVPPNVVIPAGNTTASFAIVTKAVAKEVMPIISATAAGVTLKQMVMPEPIPVASASIKPSPVVGGKSAKGTVNLTFAAAPGAITVTVSSSSANAKPAVKNLTIAKGKKSATFALTTLKVKSPQTITLKFQAQNTSNPLTIKLTINPK